MDSSERKRRRISPKTKTNTAEDNGGDGASTTPPDPPPGPALRSGRSSIASPTQAIPSHNQSSRRRNRRDSQRRDEAAPSASRPTSRGDGVTSDLLSAQLEREGSSDGALRTTRSGPRESAARDLRSDATDAARSSARRIGGILSAPPRPSPARPSPRPLPPPGPIADEDILNPFARRGLRRSGIGIFPSAEERPEPQLPPTPEHPDPVLTTPPSGIHSPSARRAKRLAERTKKSPLKQPPLKPPAPEGYMTAGGQPGSSDTKAETPLYPNPARGVKPFDPDAPKKRNRDALLAEVAQLERDLAVATAENERIRQSRSTRRGASSPPNRDDILDVLRRNFIPQEETAPDPTSEWLQTAMDPMAILPFGKKGVSVASMFTQETVLEKEAPPISHHPIQMTAEEELPYLKAFASLKLSSTITMLRRDSEDDPLLQRHSITVTSANPPGVFSAQIEMTVSTKTLIITDLSVPRMDPAAFAELNPLIERLLGDGEPSSPLTRNVNVLGWAMGEWLRVSLKRAVFWVLLDRELGTADALTDSVVAVRTRKRRKRRRAGTGEDVEADVSWQGLKASGIVSKADLLLHMGRTSMDIDIPSASDADETKTALRVFWRIMFDWTGEAQSRVGILVGVPGKWRNADEGGSFSGLSDLFDQLVQGDKDPATAVKTIVTLLAGEDAIP